MTQTANRVRILMIDDDEDSVVLAREQLRQSGRHDYEVDWHASPETGLDALLTGEHDVCLLDLHLGTADGLELLKQAVTAGCLTPIIVLTGSASARGVNDGTVVGLGASDFLGKHHLTGEMLDRSIRYAVERYRLIRALRSEQGELQQSARRLRVIVDNALEGLIVVDEQGDVRFANAGAEQLWQDHIHEVLDVLVTLPEGADQPTEIRLVAANGPARIAEARAAQLEWDGAPARIVSLRDITVYRALEAQLRQSQRMDAVGRLTGGVAHDLNNVLTIVLASAQIIRDAVPGEVGPEVADIIEATTRGAAMIRKLLAFSRQQQLTLEVVDLGAALEESVQLLRRLLPESINLSYRASPAPAVRVDVGAMEQVLTNLLTNARDAVSDGGDVVIAVRLADAAEAHAPGLSNPCVLLEVADTGSGIAPEHLGHIFEPFFSTKPEARGTGLGLAMVQSLVTQQGGVVRVTSTVGAGTTFRVFLPGTAESVPGPTSVASGRPIDGGTESIFVVEDEVAIRRTVRRVLERAGYRVYDAENGRQALAMIDESPFTFDLLVSDIVMPEMGGIELLRQLQDRGVHVATIFMSGYDPGQPESGTAVPGQSFLQKPFDVADLLARVRGELDRARTG